MRSPFPPPWLDGTLLEQAPLAPRTTLRLGGPARWLFRPASYESLARLLRERPGGLPLFILGGGSNLLVEDDGFDGVAVDLSGGLNRLRWVPASEDPHASDGSRLIEAEAGVDTRTLAHLARRNGLTGAEFLSGIPGALGGALRMNAGAYGGEIRDILTDAELLDEAGRRRRLAVERLGMSYRQTAIPAGWTFLSARFRLHPDDPEAIRQRMRALNRKRAASQPLGSPSAGSMFRNPPGGPPAWRLIDQAGLRGLAIGGAQISTRHANFFINAGGARAVEMLRLIDHAREAVRRDSGVELALEVKILGANGLRTWDQGWGKNVSTPNVAGSRDGNG